MKEGFVESPDKNRFQVDRKVLWVDRLMDAVVRSGGSGVIAAVTAIFLFIAWQVWPLFRGARVKPIENIPLVDVPLQAFPDEAFMVFGSDEWTELPFLLRRNGDFLFLDLKGVRGVFERRPPFEKKKNITAAHYAPKTQTVVLGTHDGFFSILALKYRPIFQEGARMIDVDIEAEPFVFSGVQGRITALSHAATSKVRLVAAVLETPFSGKRVVLSRMIREEDFFGEGTWALDVQQDITKLLDEEPKRVLVKPTGDGVVVLTADGAVHYLTLQGERFSPVQNFQPFAEQTQGPLIEAEFLLGGNTLVLTGASGKSMLYSLYPHKPDGVLRFGKIGDLPEVPTGEEKLFFAASLRNKAFLSAKGSWASLRYATTRSIRWEEKLPFEIAQAALSPKYDRLLFLDTQNRLHVYALDDPHPEAGWRAFFGKIWYEGHDRPKYEWQSTGGSDDFESKFSMVPLLIGSLKGTFYALLFAVPLALLAAFYVAEFMDQKYKIYIKPAMEIMASLPSVILGFLAALYVAPLLEERVPALAAAAFCIPLGVLAWGWFFSSLPAQRRPRWLRAGMEGFFLLPWVSLLFWASFMFGPWLESLLCRVPDPATGQVIADFRLWWPKITGTPFEQRNAVVVGFMMGFAVMPILFTIAEDAFSSVPKALRSAALALGASPWQTAVHVVLPTAAAGVFSAVMIAFGRAVGETMIVLMATGNTPVLDFSPFTGMRTLAANIAVELPEAPYGGTLYRALFLGGLLLFLMTFFINTLAEVLRQHLREKYKTI